jgi:TolB-like protein
MIFTKMAVDKINLKNVVFLLLAMLLMSCSWTQGPQGNTVSVVSPDFFGIGDNLAVQLADGLRRPLGNNKRLIVTTVVNIDNLYQTSRFGRTLTETLATQLFNHGFGVVEVRKSSDLLIKNSKGELMLTRDAKLLAKEYEAEAVAVGTYSMTPSSVIVNVRLLSTVSQDVLSVAGLEIERSKNINYLLAMAGGHHENSLSVYER